MEESKSNVFTKLQKVRAEIVGEGTKKSGSNSYSGYSYFELEDFIPNAMLKFQKYNLCPVISYPSREQAKLTIYDAENPDSFIVFESPMGTAELKGCHDAQKLGAAETYVRRYLYIAALELTEHDALEVTRVEPNGSGKSANIKEKIEEITRIIESIKKVDKEKYTDKILEIVRKHNKVARYTLMKDSDAAKADKIIGDLSDLFDTIEGEAA